MYYKLQKILIFSSLLLAAILFFNTNALAEEMTMSNGENRSFTSTTSTCKSTNSSCVSAHGESLYAGNYKCTLIAGGDNCSATVTVGANRVINVQVGNESTMGGGTSTGGGGGRGDEATNTGNNAGSLTCDYILGGYDNPDDLGYYLAKLLEIIKFLGPILVIVMTIVDLVKIIALGKPEELNKLAVKTVKRIIYAVLLFIIPSLLDWLFKLFSVYGVCIPS